jgi:hypothetical protein
VSDEEETPLEEAPAGENSGGKKDKKVKKAKKDTEDKKDKKDKKGKKSPSEGLTIAGHPRAGAQVRMAKGWGGLIAFGVTAYLSLSAGLSPDQVGLRALGAGIGGYLVGWACSVTIWRHLLIAELRALAEHAHARPSAAPAEMITVAAPAPGRAPAAAPVPAAAEATGQAE